MGHKEAGETLGHISYRGQMRQDKVHIWPQLSQSKMWLVGAIWRWTVQATLAVAKLRVTMHLSQERHEKKAFLERKEVESKGEKCVFPVYPTRCPESCLPLPHSLLSSCASPPPCHCLPFPSSRNVLLDAHPKPFYFKSIPLPLPQEAFSHQNITKADVQPCTWVPALRGCEFTYLVRGSQSTFLESGSVLGSSVAQLPKINTDSGHITRGIPRLGKEKTFAPWTSQS